MEAKAVTEAAAEQVKVDVRPFERRKPGRRPLPKHLRARRWSTRCRRHARAAAGRCNKLGEDVSQTL